MIVSIDITKTIKKQNEVNFSAIILPNETFFKQNGHANSESICLYR